MASVVFAFFGYPGAGKSTLCRRFGELSGVPAIDTDAFMTAIEREAAETGRYTRAMRLANMRRYAQQARKLLRKEPCVAVADGLPNAAARAYLRRELSEAEVVFVLVTAPRDLWQQRLAARQGNTVAVGVAEAEAYVREHWEPLEPSFEYEVIENTEDAAVSDEALRALYERYRRP